MGDYLPDIDLKALTKALYERRYQAVDVPHVEVSMANGPAIEHECHNNADRWINEHPDNKSVRGWIVFDFNRTSEGWMPVCRFTAHSVVEARDGTLFDLTPSKASKRYPFLRHEGPEGHFEAIVIAGCIHLEYLVEDE